MNPIDNYAQTKQDRDNLASFMWRSRLRVTLKPGQGARSPTIEDRLNDIITEAVNTDEIREAIDTAIANYFDERVKTAALSARSIAVEVLEDDKIASDAGIQP